MSQASRVEIISQSDESIIKRFSKSSASSRTWGCVLNGRLYIMVFNSSRVTPHDWPPSHCGAAHGLNSPCSYPAARYQGLMCLTVRYFRLSILSNHSNSIHALALPFYLKQGTRYKSTRTGPRKLGPTTSPTIRYKDSHPPDSTLLSSLLRHHPRHDLTNDSSPTEVWVRN